jgi:hypothetical protein
MIPPVESFTQKLLSPKGLETLQKAVPDLASSAYNNPHSMTSLHLSFEHTPDGFHLVDSCSQVGETVGPSKVLSRKTFQDVSEVLGQLGQKVITTAKETFNMDLFNGEPVTIDHQLLSKVFDKQFPDWGLALGSPNRSRLIGRTPIQGLVDAAGHPLRDAQKLVIAPIPEAKAYEIEVKYTPDRLSKISNSAITTIPDSDGQSVFWNNQTPTIYGTTMAEVPTHQYPSGKTFSGFGGEVKTGSTDSGSKSDFTKTSNSDLLTTIK